MNHFRTLRPSFLVFASLGFATLLWSVSGLRASESALPEGGTPAPLEAAWFPSRLHTFVWRNWGLLPVERLAEVVKAKPEDIRIIAQSMGLEAMPRVLSGEMQRRAYITIIRRNWHLLPYDQLLALLGWDTARLAYVLLEDDFLFHKLGRVKPAAAPLHWSPPTADQQARSAEITTLVREAFPKDGLAGEQPLFAFIEDFKRAPPPPAQTHAVDFEAPLRIAYSYFALSGDPLIDPSLGPYPEGLLARLAESGANAVWLHVELPHLADMPWAPDDRVAKRIETLRGLTQRAAAQGMRVFLYFNEPRTLAASSPVFTAHPGWRGVEVQGRNAVCTSAEEVRRAIRDGITSICRAVPGLGGFITITASENQTNCWSHGKGGTCPRCKERQPAEVIAEVSATIAEGIRAAGGKQRYLAWDWGWRDEWAQEAISLLPKDITLQSVSEWSLPIERGGVKSIVGEYSISSIGPGPRAQKQWAAAKQHGLRISAKIQCGNTWELSAVPYFPVVENVTRHAAALREAGVQDIMLGWTLGSHPSPNLAAVGEVFGGGTLETLARKHHGAEHVGAITRFWRECSAAFREFPYHQSVVYRAPLQMGPANVLWASATQYQSTMVGLPYDDLKGWRAVYPAEVFAAQLEKVATGFEAAIMQMRASMPAPTPALTEELHFAEVAAIHFASVANQSRAVTARDAGDREAWRKLCDAEAQLAIRLHALQSRDSRIGFEASNHYYYTPLDLVEKVINCRWGTTQIKAK